MVCFIFFSYQNFNIYIRFYDSNYLAHFQILDIFTLDLDFISSIKVVNNFMFILKYK